MPSTRYRLPPSRPPGKSQLDVTADELVESVDRRMMRAIWPDLPTPVAFSVYPLEEISAEKLRRIIQRVQCRDLYDLWRLTEDMGIDLDEVLPIGSGANNMNVTLRSWRLNGRALAPCLFFDSAVSCTAVSGITHRVAVVLHDEGVPGQFESLGATASPTRITEITRTALVLTQFEHKYIK